MMACQLAKPSQPISVHIDGQLRWLVKTNRKHCTSLGKANTNLIVHLAPHNKTIKTLGRGLIVNSDQLTGTLVNLNSRKEHHFPSLHQQKACQQSSGNECPRTE
uniref:Uncharacterized protein n=1 Tax=Kalanchoe fedtschenkoi TaxID=63787 RepID=A0A7N0VLA1_KALFE